MKNWKSAVMASAVAAMFAANAAHAQDAKAPAKAAAKGVKCSGINSCKGKGACKGADNDCKGQNGCKGKGWTQAKSEKACTGKHGTVVAEAAAPAEGEAKPDAAKPDAAKPETK
ncbi:MAG TPA: hypothetical protein VIG99_30335 [Myxococcaceae bacterium]|jgi:hypothetical protein